MILFLGHIIRSNNFLTFCHDLFDNFNYQPPITYCQISKNKFHKYLFHFQPTSSNQLQLVQGPDGQFILQSAPAPAQPTPTILSQTVSSLECKQILEI
jgi:hypothetical protein